MVMKGSGKGEKKMMSEASSLEYRHFSVASLFSSNLSYTLALVTGGQKKKRINHSICWGVIFLVTIISIAEQSFERGLQTALLKVRVTFADRGMCIFKGKSCWQSDCLHMPPLHSGAVWPSMV